MLLDTERVKGKGVKMRYNNRSTKLGGKGDFGIWEWDGKE